MKNKKKKHLKLYQLICFRDVYKIDSKFYEIDFWADRIEKKHMTCLEGNEKTFFYL
jgi:hypothetical protein